MMHIKLKHQRKGIGKRKRSLVNEFLLFSLVFLLTVSLLGGVVSAADIHIIDDNIDIGNITLFSQNCSQIGAVPNNTFLWNFANASGITENESLTYNSTTGTLDYNVSTGYSGNLIIGGFKPSPESIYHFKLNLFSDDWNSAFYFYHPYAFRVGVQRNWNNKYIVYSIYHDETGSWKYAHIYTDNTGILDLYIHYYGNNNTVHVYTACNQPGVTTTFFPDRPHPHPYVSRPVIRVVPYLSHVCNWSTLQVIFIEQKIPRKLVTAVPPNKEFFAFCFDLRTNTFNGTDWLNSRGYKATCWGDIGTNVYVINKTKELINDGWELGIHYHERLTDLSLDEAYANMTDERSQIISTYGKEPLTWCSLQGADNETHAKYAYDNWGMIWRNHPLKGLPGGGNIYSDNYEYWANLAQRGIGSAAFTHSVSTPAEGWSLTNAEFELIMSQYINNGVEIVPFGWWYFVLRNIHDANFTNIDFASDKYRFTANTNSYPAYVNIYDYYNLSDTYSVIFAVDNNSNIVQFESIVPHNKSESFNLWVENNHSYTIQKITAIPSLGSVNLTISNFTITYKKWNESSASHSTTVNHIIGDFPSDTYIVIKKNGNYWKTITSNSSGYITFTYDEGFSISSAVTFELISSPILDRGPGEYPSIMGTHNGTITPYQNQTITVSKLHTYPCPGTGGHTEYVRIWGSGIDENATWNGYVGDWHNITFGYPFTLESGKTYNYTIRTGSYPQIIHRKKFNATGGKITCTEFIDANGRKYDDWIPAIWLEGENRI